MLGIIERYYPYIVPENDGVEIVLSFDSKRHYTHLTHYTNTIFDNYDFVAREQFPVAYEHLKLVVLNDKKDKIIYIPDREKYSDAFRDFRRVPGASNNGVDIAFSESIVNEVLLGVTEEIGMDKSFTFNLYFFPDPKTTVKTGYTKTEILEDKVTRLEKETKQMKKDMDMKFEIMKRDLEMRLEIGLNTKRSK